MGSLPLPPNFSLPPEWGQGLSRSPSAGLRQQRARGQPRPGEVEPAWACACLEDRDSLKALGLDLQ